MKRKTPFLYLSARQYFYSLVAFLLLASYTHSAAQTGYIYLHKKTLSEENSPDFTFSVSGGPTTVSPITLNDQPSTFSKIAGLGSDADGGLWATSGNAANAQGNYPIYYRAPNSSTWTLKPGTGVATNIDGGASGTYISISANDGHVHYFDGTTETDVTGNLPLAAIDVSDNWVGGQYAVLSDHTIWKRTLPSLTWTMVPGQASVVDARPNDPNVYLFTDATGQQVYTSNGVTQTSLGNPDGLTTSAVTTLAYTANGAIYAQDTQYAYRRTGTGWVVENLGNNLGSLTGGPASQLWGVALSNGTAVLNRIWSRAQTSDYIADENVRTSANDNSVLLPVQAGTYTISEAAVAGWNVSNITLYETQSTTSTKDIANRTATVVVSAGEVVHVIFENQLVQTTAITNTCSTASTFIETFGTGTGYGPALTGLISYHRATGTFGYGYYAVINNSSLMGTYARNYTDHTGDVNGRMLAVDATGEPGVFYRRRFTNLIPGASYNFSAWAMNVNALQDLPNISFEVYDPATGTLLNSSSTGNIPNSSRGIWKQSSLVFTATQSTIDLVLRNNTRGTIGNDLALDDISFGLALPTTPIIASSPASCVTGVGSLTVTSPIGPSLQYSLNGGSYQPGTVFSNLTPGVYSAVASYTTANGCSSTPTSVTISLATPPVLSPISGPSTVCSSTPTSYTYTNSSTGGVWTVSPTSLATIDASTGVLTTIASMTGTTTVTYSVTSQAGCVSRTSLPVSVSSCASLPVSLVNFSVQSQTDHTVLVTWRTSWESGNKQYVIERSKDLIKFESVGEVTDVAGNSNSISSYRFVDSSPYRGTSYYRLRQVDQDGSNHVYPARSVEIDGLYGTYPNPVRDGQFTLTLDEPQSALVSLFSTDGRAVPLQTTPISDRSLNLKIGQKLPTGIYFLIVKERGQVRQYRIVID